MNTMEPTSPQSTTSTGGDLHSERECSTLEINRGILKEVAALYNPPDITLLCPPTKPGTFSRFSTPGTSNVNNKFSEHTLGLQAIGRHLELNIGLVHKKAVVVVIGNISAGKSTFINWFVQEAVQKTGMAIETSGFTFVTNGRCLNEIGGESTLTLRPYLIPLTKKYRGFVENLSLKTCPSYGGRLQLLDLVDTPGLADGELQYPFDVEELLIEMSSFVDLFVVFFDPIGQALGKRMLSVVKRLHDICPDKIRFCLSKVDEIRTEEERIKVMCQTTQSLTAKINTRHGFDLIPIYVPGAKDGSYLSTCDNTTLQQKTPIVNRIRDLTIDMEKATERRVQDSLNRLMKDVTSLTTVVEKKLQKYELQQQQLREHHSVSLRRSLCRLGLYLIVIFLGILQVRREELAFQFTATINYWLSQIDSRAVKLLDYSATALGEVEYGFRIAWIVLILLFFCTISFSRPTRLTPNEKEQCYKFMEYAEFLKAARLKWKQLNSIYMNHSLDDSQTIL